MKQNLRGQLIRQGEEGIKKLTESKAREMTEEDFNGFAFELKIVIASRFSHVPAVASFVADKGRKYNNETLKVAARSGLSMRVRESLRRY